MAIRSPFGEFDIRMRRGMRIATPACALARNDMVSVFRIIHNLEKNSFGLVHHFAVFLR